MSLVKVVFARQHRVASLLLRTFLWSAWSHCAVVDGDEVIEASALHGVRTRPLADLLADASQYEVVDVPSLNPAAVIAAARAELGKPYDWFGVAGFGFRRQWQEPDSWFCSELVAWAFHAAGQPLFRVETWRITPRDIYAPIFRGSA